MRWDCRASQQAAEALACSPSMPLAACSWLAVHDFIGGNSTLQPTNSPGELMHTGRWKAQAVPPVELLGVEAQGLVEGCALVVVQVHGHIH